MIGGRGGLGLPFPRQFDRRSWGMLTTVAMKAIGISLRTRNISQTQEQFVVLNLERFRGKIRELELHTGK